MLRKLLLVIFLIFGCIPSIYAQPSSTFILAVSDDTSTVYTNHIGFTGASLSEANGKAIITITSGGGGAPTNVDYLVGTANGTLSNEIVVGTTPGGDLGNTWPDPQVDDDSHAHTTTSLSGIDISADTNLAVTAPVVLTDDTLSLTVAKDIVAGVGLSGGEDNVLPGADADTTLTVDATELEGLTWGAGGNASNVWTFNVSGTDTTLTLGNALWTISHGLVISGTTTIGTLAGTIDAGSATSLEIPNGASPTVNAAGEIAIDTTDDQLTYYGGAERVIPYTHEKCFSLETPVVGDDNVPIWSPNDAITITSQYCRTQGGTSCQITVSDGTNDMEAITCDSDGQADDGTLINNTFTAGERMEFDTGTVSGSVTWVNFCNRYTVDRQ